MTTATDGRKQVLEAHWSDPRWRPKYLTQLAFWWDNATPRWGLNLPLHDLPADVREDARLCWSIFEDEVQEIYDAAHGANAIYGRPSGWWIFSEHAPDPWDYESPEWILLWRMGLLSTEDAREALMWATNDDDIREFYRERARAHTTPEEQEILRI